MSRAQKCPVCGGTGKIVDQDDGPSTAAPQPRTCHGCGGKGWVQVGRDDPPAAPWPLPTWPWDRHPLYPWGPPLEPWVWGYEITYIPNYKINYTSNTEGAQRPLLYG